MRLIATLFILLTCSQAQTAEKDSDQRPTVGVIRWDAFHGEGGVTAAVEKSLGPARYHQRAPFFTEVTGKDQLSINGGSDEVMQQEIAYAAEAGVYWAFLTYPWQGNLASSLRRFLEHPDRDRVDFTLILGEHALVQDWDRFYRQTLEKACAMPNYHTVLEGRPLIHFFKYIPPKERLDEIRTLVKQKTGKDPYLVFLMHGVPKSKWPELQALGFDASTKYAQFPYQPKMTYAAFDQQVRRDWQSWVKAEYQHSPLLSAGWDNRPRYYNPVPWIPKSEKMLSRYAETPTPEELAAHVKAGMDFVYRNPEFCEAQDLLMYAWNEHDEGGWLCPTLDPKTGGIDDSRVKAVGKVIRGWRPGEAVAVTVHPPSRGQP